LNCERLDMSGRIVNPNHRSATSNRVKVHCNARGVTLRLMERGLTSARYVHVEHPGEARRRVVALPAVRHPERAGMLRQDGAEVP
jgi:hypothetical protein